MVLIFIVIIIGGLGSVGGCFIGALLVALIANYAGFLAPKVALVSNILLMVPSCCGAPQGLYPVAKRLMPMLSSLLSGDLPRSRVLAVVLVAILLGARPRAVPVSGRAPLNVAAKICVFIVLVASYDLLLGYTGIVSFAHTMFFGIGGYGVGARAVRLRARPGARSLLGLAVALPVARRCWRSLIGLFSLRVRAIFFAMITLAVASAFAVLASQLSDFTGGEDGRTFQRAGAAAPGLSA